MKSDSFPNQFFYKLRYLNRVKENGTTSFPQLWGDKRGKSQNVKEVRKIFSHDSLIIYFISDIFKGITFHSKLRVLNGIEKQLI